jgi:hypothetical protein
MPTGTSDVIASADHKAITFMTHLPKRDGIDAPQPRGRTRSQTRSGLGPWATREQPESKETGRRATQFRHTPKRIRAGRSGMGTAAACIPMAWSGGMNSTVQTGETFSVVAS